MTTLAVTPASARDAFVTALAQMLSMARDTDLPDDLAESIVDRYAEAGADDATFATFAGFATLVSLDILNCESAK